MGDFTLYFLAYDHSGKTLTAEEKVRSRFGREGEARHLVIVNFYRTADHVDATCFNILRLDFDICA
jgi:hypothetical protein